MEIRVREWGPVDVVDVHGKFVGTESAAILRHRLETLLNAGESLLVLNLSGVSRLDSGCIGELVACRERVRKCNGRVMLVLNASLRDLFVTAGLDRLFEVFGDEDEALDEFRAVTETAGIP